MTKNDFAIDYSNRLVVAAIAIPRECAQLASLFTLETVSENRMGEQLLDYYASNSILKESHTFALSVSPVFLADWVWIRYNVFHSRGFCGRTRCKHTG